MKETKPNLVLKNGSVNTVEKDRRWVARGRAGVDLVGFRKPTRSGKSGCLWLRLCFTSRKCFIFAFDLRQTFTEYAYICDHKYQIDHRKGNRIWNPAWHSLLATIMGTVPMRRGVLISCGIRSGRPGPPTRWPMAINRITITAMIKIFRMPKPNTVLKSFKMVRTIITCRST